MYTHTDPRIEVFCDSSWHEGVPFEGHWKTLGGASGKKFSNFFTTEKRINLTVVAENVCPVVTRLFEKITIKKSEGRTNIADKDKTRTQHRS